MLRFVNCLGTSLEEAPVQALPGVLSLADPSRGSTYTLTGKSISSPANTQPTWHRSTHICTTPGWSAGPTVDLPDSAASSHSFEPHSQQLHSSPGSLLTHCTTSTPLSTALSSQQHFFFSGECSAVLKLMRLPILR